MATCPLFRGLTKRPHCRAEVEFELKEGPKGLQALDVVCIHPPSNGTVPEQPALSREIAPETTGDSVETMSPYGGVYLAATSLRRR